VTPDPKGLVCPASTEADGRPVGSPVGYVIKAALAAGADSTKRQLEITKSCSFRYRGRFGGFAEGGAWELRREGGLWRVSATLSLWIT